MNTHLSPDEMLSQIEKESAVKKMGKLKIFFGYAAGVGKTYAMLKAAHEAKEKGLDVVVGYVEPHARPQTAALIEGLEVVATKEYIYNNIVLNELDIDYVLKRMPQLVLVDELAHTNCPGSRHDKRYQDVEELIKNGINVYTTVNVQHIESLNDMVASITGVSVRERILDSVFDDADQVELVDIEPQELIERLYAGKIYKEEQTKRALSHFFSLENLIALREIALRRCADRVSKRVENVRYRANGNYFTDEHILVCLSTSPSNAKIIRTAARMASAFKGTFTALFIETSDFVKLSDENQNRLRTNIRLAQQLGATIEIGYGNDVSFQIAEFARLSGVSKIVVGRNSTRRRTVFSKPTLVEKLTTLSPNLDVYIIPDKDTPFYKQSMSKVSKRKNIGLDTCKSLLILTVATLIGFLFYEMKFSEANIITIYILCVLLTAVSTTQRGFSLVVSVISVLVFNFFFTEPRFTLSAYDSGYPVTFLIMLLAAFITSTLAVKIKENAKKAAQVAFRTKVLLDANQMVQMADSKEKIVSVIANQLVKLLGKDIVVYMQKDGLITEPLTFKSSELSDSRNYLTENEKAVANWVFKNNKHAGATTNTLSNSACLYLAIRVNQKVYGVLGIFMEGTQLESFENSIVLSILGECALALENEKIAKEKEAAAVLAKNEQLRANLLRTISHDLRTPLTSISGNAGVLLSSENKLSEIKKKQLYSDIYEDSAWLINLVENLLAITRIEEGSLHLKMNAELIDEVVEEAIKHVNHHKNEYKIVIENNEELVLAKMDVSLIVQVIVNLVDNAIKYTPRGSTITICTTKKDKIAVIAVKDNGPGIPDKDKPNIFDRFYTVDSRVSDSKRSLGLGLALCKSIVNLHQGELFIEDNVPCGAVFKFTLPIEEVKIHE